MSLPADEKMLVEGTDRPAGACPGSDASDVDAAEAVDAWFPRPPPPRPPAGALQRICFCVICTDLAG